MKKERESGFDLSFNTSKLPEYNGLFDSNLRHYFENRKVQKHLSRVGLVRGGGGTVGCMLGSCSSRDCVTARPTSRLPPLVQRGCVSRLTTTAT